MLCFQHPRACRIGGRAGCCGSCLRGVEIVLRDLILGHQPPVAFEIRFGFGLVGLRLAHPRLGGLETRLRGRHLVLRRLEPGLGYGERGLGILHLASCRDVGERHVGTRGLQRSE